jgi:hypothetical protein
MREEEGWLGGARCSNKRRFSAAGNHNNTTTTSTNPAPFQPIIFLSLWFILLSVLSAFYILHFMLTSPKLLDLFRVACICYCPVSILEL